MSLPPLIPSQFSGGGDPPYPPPPGGQGPPRPLSPALSPQPPGPGGGYPGGEDGIGVW